MLCLAQFYRSRFRPRLVAASVRPDTLADYDRLVRLAPDPIDEDGAVRWLSSLEAAAATRNKYRRYLLAIMRYAARQGLTDHWDLPRSAEDHHLPRAWTVSEFSRLLKATDTLCESYCGVCGQAWWRSLLLVLWYTGERVGSVIACKWEDCDLSERTLIVRSPKTRSEALHVLPPDAADAIWEARGGEMLIWPWPFCDRKKTLLRRVRRLIDEARLPQLATPFHAIRRSVASYVAVQLGAAVACDALRHSRMSTTERYYLDPRICRQTEKASTVMPRP